MKTEETMLLEKTETAEIPSSDAVKASETKTKTPRPKATTEKNVADQPAKVKAGDLPVASEKRDPPASSVHSAPHAGQSFPPRLNMGQAPGAARSGSSRTSSKPERFEVGDYVVYPTHGVGKVERIAVEEIAGHRLELIHITFDENRMTLRVPVSKAQSAGLRKLVSRKMFEEALAIIKGKARIKRTMWSRRAQEYEAKINSGDPLAVAEVIRDLHRKVGQPDQSFSERQIFEAAMDRLAAELAALERIDKAEAAQRLADFLKTL